MNPSSHPHAESFPGTHRDAHTCDFHAYTYTHARTQIRRKDTMAQSALVVMTAWSVCVCVTCASRRRCWSPLASSFRSSLRRVWLLTWRTCPHSSSHAPTHWARTCSHQTSMTGTSHSAQVSVCVSASETAVLVCRVRPRAMAWLAKLCTLCMSAKCLCMRSKEQEHGNNVVCTDLCRHAHTRGLLWPQGRY